MRTQVAALILAAGLTCAESQAADGDLDLSFANDGTYLLEAQGYDELPTATIPKLVAAPTGIYVLYTLLRDGIPVDRITKLLRSGALDTSFKDSGHLDLDYLSQMYANYAVSTLAVDDNGRIYIAGNASTLNNHNMLVCRLKANAMPDTEWGGSNGCTTIAFDLMLNGVDLAQTIHLLKDGRVLIAGRAAVTASIDTMAAARLDQNGNWDLSFGPGGKYTSSTSKTEAVDIDVDWSGRILLGGNLYVDDCNTDMYVERVSAGGTVQASQIIKWDIGVNCGEKKEKLTGIHAMPDRSVWVSGGATYGFNGESDWKLCTAKLTSDTLSLDLSYNGTGKTNQFICDVCQYSQVSSSAIQSDGKMLVAGVTNIGTDNYDLFVSRIGSNGQSDYSLFSITDYVMNNISASEWMPSIGIQSGRPIVATQSTLIDELYTRIAVSRLENDLIYADRFGN